MKKRMEIENVALLKTILEMELTRLREKKGIDIVLFYGVDGRLFSSSVPTDLNIRQYQLLNMLKENLVNLCAQLRTRNMNVSIQTYNEGAIILSGVGKNAFLANIIAKEVAIEDIMGYLTPIINTGIVVKHLFELKPMKEESMAQYSPEVVEELMLLSKKLFKQKFKQTKDYRKNEEILEFIKKKLKEVIGHGNINEIITLTFNEMGCNVGNMNRANWNIFMEVIIDNHVRKLAGDVMADQCKITGIPAVDKKIKSFI